MPNANARVPIPWQVSSPVARGLPDPPGLARLALLVSLLRNMEFTRARPFFMRVVNAAAGPLIARLGLIGLIGLLVYGVNMHIFHM